MAESEGVVEIERQEYDKSIGVEEIIPEVEFRGKVSNPFNKKKKSSARRSVMAIIGVITVIIVTLIVGYEDQTLRSIAKL